jgi:hypothetical protein
MMKLRNMLILFLLITFCVADVAAILPTWALDTSNKPWYRTGVTAQKPMGDGWAKDSSSTLSFVHIFTGSDGTVWACTGQQGGMYLKSGLSVDNPAGGSWSNDPLTLAESANAILFSAKKPGAPGFAIQKDDTLSYPVRYNAYSLAQRIYVYSSGSIANQWTVGGDKINFTANGSVETGVNGRVWVCNGSIIYHYYPWSYTHTQGYTKTYTPISGKNLVKISIGPDDQVCGVDASGNVWFLTQLVGKVDGNQVSVWDKKTSAYVNVEGDTFSGLSNLTMNKSYTFESSWAQDTSISNVKYISYGIYGHLWAIKNDNTVWFSEGFGIAWKQVSLPAGITFKKIETGALGIALETTKSLENMPLPPDVFGKITTLRSMCFDAAIVNKIIVGSSKVWFTDIVKNLFSLASDTEKEQLAVFLKDVKNQSLFEPSLYSLIDNDIAACDPAFVPKKALQVELDKLTGVFSNDVSIIEGILQKIDYRQLMVDALLSAPDQTIKSIFTQKIKDLFAKRTGATSEQLNVLFNVFVKLADPNMNNYAAVFDSPAYSTLPNDKLIIAKELVLLCIKNAVSKTDVVSKSIELKNAANAAGYLQETFDQETKTSFTNMAKEIFAAREVAGVAENLPTILSAWALIDQSQYPTASMDSIILSLMLYPPQGWAIIQILNSQIMGYGYLDESQINAETKKAYSKLASTVFSIRKEGYVAYVKNVLNAAKFLDATVYPLHKVHAKIWDAEQTVEEDANKNKIMNPLNAPKALNALKDAVIAFDKQTIPTTDFVTKPAFTIVVKLLFGVRQGLATTDLSSLKTVLNTAGLFDNTIYSDVQRAADIATLEKEISPSALPALNTMLTTVGSASAITTEILSTLQNAFDMSLTGVSVDDSTKSNYAAALKNIFAKRPAATVANKAVLELIKAKLITGKSKDLLFVAAKYTTIDADTSTVTLELAKMSIVAAVQTELNKYAAATDKAKVLADAVTAVGTEITKANLSAEQKTSLDLGTEIKGLFTTKLNELMQSIPTGVAVLVFKNFLTDATSGLLSENGLRLLDKSLCSDDQRNKYIVLLSVYAKIVEASVATTVSAKITALNGAIAALGSGTISANDTVIKKAFTDIAKTLFVQRSGQDLTVLKTILSATVLIESQADYSETTRQQQVNSLIVEIAAVNANAVSDFNAKVAILKPLVDATTTPPGLLTGTISVDVSVAKALSSCIGGLFKLRTLSADFTTLKALMTVLSANASLYDSSAYKGATGGTNEVVADIATLDGESSLLSIDVLLKDFSTKSLAEKIKALQAVKDEAIKTIANVSDGVKGMYTEYVTGLFKAWSELPAADQISLGSTLSSFLSGLESEYDKVLSGLIDIVYPLRMVHIKIINAASATDKLAALKDALSALGSKEIPATDTATKPAFTAVMKNLFALRVNAREQIKAFLDTATIPLLDVSKYSNALRQVHIRIIEAELTASAAATDIAKKVSILGFAVDEAQKIVAPESIDAATQEAFTTLVSGLYGAWNSLTAGKFDIVGGSPAVSLAEYVLNFIKTKVATSALFVKTSYASCDADIKILESAVNTYSVSSKLNTNLTTIKNAQAITIETLSMLQSIFDASLTGVSIDQTTKQNFADALKNVYAKRPAVTTETITLLTAIKDKLTAAKNVTALFDANLYTDIDANIAAIQTELKTYDILTPLNTKLITIKNAKQPITPEIVTALQGVLDMSLTGISVDQTTKQNFADALKNVYANRPVATAETITLLTAIKDKLTAAKNAALFDAGLYTTISDDIATISADITKYQAESSVGTSKTPQPESQQSTQASVESSTAGRLLGAWQATDSSTAGVGMVMMPGTAPAPTPDTAASSGTGVSTGTEKPQAAQVSYESTKAVKDRIAKVKAATKLTDKIKKASELVAWAAGRNFNTDSKKAVNAMVGTLYSASKTANKQTKTELKKVLNNMKNTNLLSSAQKTSITTKYIDKL